MSESAPVAKAAFDAAALIEEGKSAAEHGTDILKAFWSRMSPTQQKVLTVHHARWKETAAQKDVENAEFEGAAQQSNILSAG